MALKDRDGNILTSVVIGTQEWIVENLRTTHYADGQVIPNLTECDDPERPDDIYGALYNWWAANDARNIC